MESWISSNTYCLPTIECIKTMKMWLNTTSMVKSQCIFVTRKKNLNISQTQLAIIVVLITAVIVILQQPSF